MMNGCSPLHLSPSHITQSGFNSLLQAIKQKSLKAAKLFFKLTIDIFSIIKNSLFHRVLLSSLGFTFMLFTVYNFDRCASHFQSPVLTFNSHCLLIDRLV